MLNLKTRNLLLLICLTKSTVLFSLNRAPIPPQDLSTLQIFHISTLGFSAGLALGNGNLRHSLLAASYTRFMIEKFIADPDNKKTCTVLFATYAMLGFGSTVLCHASSANKS